MLERLLERRRSRSESPTTALTLLLAQVATESRLAAVALVSEAGGLVAKAAQAAWPGDALRDLAAAVPGAYAGEESSTWEAATGGRDLYARAVDVFGRRFYLASVGAPVRRARNAEEGIRRILAHPERA